jgi:ferric hydroxamate transport system permease protein
MSLSIEQSPRLSILSGVRPDVTVTPDRQPPDGDQRALLLAALCSFVLLWLAGWRLATALPPREWVEALLLPSQQLSLQALLWRFTLLPQLTMALLVGAALGGAGALLQQGLRNPLAAPETLGIQGGGLLALALVVLYRPEWLTLFGSEWIAFAGGLLAAGLVLLLAARRQNSPLALLLAGMLVSLLCGSLLTILMLNHDLALVSLLSLQAGSLTQDGWQPVQHLWPRLLGVGALVCLLARPLRLLAVGDQGVRGFGTSPVLLRLLTLTLAIYLSANLVSQVGVISFVALAAPLLARLAGARRLLPRLGCAALLGASLLLMTDQLLALFPGGETLATGSLVALLGAPLLFWLVLRVRLPESPASAISLGARHADPQRLLLGIGFLCLLALGLALGLARDAQGWSWWAQGDWVLIQQWRLPRVLAAVAAGGMLALAGVLIQRLTANPLASPEVLGISSSCGLGLILLGLCYPEASRPLQLLVGSLSAMGLLGLMLVWSRRSQFAPLRLLLCGMTVTALFAASQSLLLGSGDPRGVQLLSWMSGSTYYVTPVLGWSLLLVMVVLGGLSWPLTRWLELLPLGTVEARSFGVDPARSRLGILLLAAVLTAASTLLVGPISFIGLLAPHLARRLGLCRAREQLPGAMGCGIVVMVLADWAGRQWLFPDQIPAGLMASLLGGGYFLFGLWRRG